MKNPVGIKPAPTINKIIEIINLDLLDITYKLSKNLIKHI